MTFSELRKKDVICIGDGRLLGRVADLEFDAQDGRVTALIVPGGGCGLTGLLHGEQNRLAVGWHKIACIGDDVILVAPGG